jgi:hypothetical protein
MCRIRDQTLIDRVHKQVQFFKSRLADQHLTPMAYSSLPTAAANSTTRPKYLLDMIPAAGQIIASAARGPLHWAKDNGDLQSGQLRRLRRVVGVGQNEVHVILRQLTSGRWESRRIPRFPAVTG